MFLFDFNDANYFPPLAEIQLPVDDGILFDTVLQAWMKQP